MGRQNRLLILIVVGALAVAAIPAVVSAAGGTFVDDDTSIFEADIEWLAASGVTKGCNPPTNDRFCPEDNVTRGQMAAFMKRFAGYVGAEDGTPGEADNADTVDGKHASEFLGATAKAADSDKLDGLSHEAFLKVGDKAADSDLLDGRNWSAFLSYDDDIPALQTMTGAFAAAAPNGSFGTAVISFFPQLRSDISETNTHYIGVSDPYTTQCPGPGQALAGHFCAYEEFNNSMTFQGKGFHDPGSGNLTGGAYQEGTIIYFNSSSAAGNVRGTWAVTAPLVFIPIPLSEQAGVGDSPSTSGE